MIAVCPKLVNLDDVRVADTRDGLGLGQEPDRCFGARIRAGQNHLQGAGAIQQAVPGAVDNSHPAPAQLAEDVEPRNPRGNPLGAVDAKRIATGTRVRARGRIVGVGRIPG